MSAAAPNDPALLYFREIVEPTAAEFMDDEADKRRGCLACLALASMTDHYFHAHPELVAPGQKTHAALDGLKSELRDANKAVGWVADVANATKHVARDRGPNRLGYGDVRSEEMGSVGVARVGRPIAGKGVLVGPEMEWRLSDLIEAGMAFWRDKLGLPPAQGGSS